MVCLKNYVSACRKTGLVPVDLHLSIVKPLSAKWLINMYDYFKANPQIICNGFRAVGITHSIQCCHAYLIHARDYMYIILIYVHKLSYWNEILTLHIYSEVLSINHGNNEKFCLWRQLTKYTLIFSCLYIYEVPFVSKLEYWHIM